MDETNKLLCKALATRLAEVQARRPDPGQDRLQPAPALDPEEALRKVMVVLYPRIQKSAATRSERVLYYTLLQGLFTAAKTADLRFLDAWNCTYEVCLQTAKGERDTMLEWALFCENYLDLIQHHLRRLST